jgi:hypothetical protein
MLRVDQVVETGGSGMPPRRHRRWLRVCAGGLALLVTTATVVRVWVVPAVIVGIIQKNYAGDVTVRDWWINRSSAGIRGLALREGFGPRSPIWAQVESVTSDLSLGALLRGRLTPRMLVLRSPRLVFRLDPNGRPLTRFPFRSTGTVGVLPDLRLVAGHVTIRQQGRVGELAMAGLDAELRSGTGGTTLRAGALDPTWGEWVAQGRLDPVMWSGTITVWGKRLVTDPALLAHLPYIPAEVWRHVAPRGPLEVHASLTLQPQTQTPLRVATDVDFRGTTLSLPSLGFVTAGTTGRLLVRDGVVQLEKIHGRALGGCVAASGTLDFAHRPPRAELTLRVEQVDAAHTPATWGLLRLGLPGRATGEARLNVRLAQEPIDLSGSSARLLIEGGTLRSTLRAEVLPRSRLTARLVAERIPLGELAALVLPRRSSLQGEATLRADAEADLTRLGNPNAWTAKGLIYSPRIVLGDSVLESPGTAFTVADGSVALSGIAARWKNKTLQGQATVGLDAPFPFLAQLEISDWDLSDLPRELSEGLRRIQLTGSLSAHTVAQGTISPLNLRDVGGQGRIGHVQIESLPLNDVSFHWTKVPGAIEVSGVAPRALGGRLTMDGRIPTSGHQDLRGTLTFAGIDLARLAALELAGGPELMGTAAGRVDYLVRRDAADNVPRLEANVALEAPDLTVEALHAKALQAIVTVRRQTLHYDIYAESLGGKIKLQGDVPLARTTDGPVLSGRVQAVGLELGELWNFMDLRGPLAELRGEAFLDATLAAPSFGLGALRGRGVLDLEGLRWGSHEVLGRLRASGVRTPEGWRLERLDGVLLGGPVHGSAWVETILTARPRAEFALDLEHVALRKALSFAPGLARQVDGAGDLHVSGRLGGDTFAVDAEAVADSARVFGVPVMELRVPAELNLSPVSKTGSFRVQRLTARVAGGRVQANALLRLGAEKAFTVAANLNGLDLEILSRLFTDARRPASGRVSGQVRLASRAPDDPRALRGRIVLDLDDAAIGEFPVLHQIDRFLGSAQGALFDDGDLSATIANREIVIEQFTLAGRLAQLHGSGTIGFNSQLNLEVLVNTGAIIPETGQTLVRLIPGLEEAFGRRGDKVSNVAGFLSNRLLKLRIAGTVRNPQVNADPAIVVTEAAVGFFGGVLKLPVDLIR